MEPSDLMTEEEQVPLVAASLDLPIKRMAEALLFAATEPMSDEALAARLPEGTDVRAVMEALAQDYAERGVHISRLAGKWAFRTADDLVFLLRTSEEEPRKLSRAALETLAIIAYHQPVTRADIEDIRGVNISKGTLDVLMETGWVRLRGRRKVPGRPVTYGTTDAFLIHFGLDSVGDLPGLEDLKGAGLFDNRLPPGFSVPMPTDDPALTEDEEPLDGDEGVLDMFLSQAPEEQDENASDALAEASDITDQQPENGAIDDEEEGIYPFEDADEAESVINEEVVEENNQYSEEVNLDEEDEDPKNNAAE